MIFPDIESYIEFLAGYRTPLGTALNSWSPHPVIKLATYDVTFVASVAEQTMTLNTPMSDRQAALSEKLVEKYARQMRQHNVEQPNHKTYRYGIRVVDRSSGVFIKDDFLHFKFPFNNNIILQVKEFLKTSQGAVRWDMETKVWKFALTEYNLSWVVTLATSNSIPVDAEVRELFDRILEEEKTPFTFELRVGEDQLGYVTNAPDSLNDYLASNVGFDNLFGLVDAAGVCGYTIAPEVEHAIASMHGKSFVKLCKSQSIDMTPNKYEVEDIIRWAINVGRLPICIYSPNFTKPVMSQYTQFFAEDEIKILSPNMDMGLPVVIDPGIKLVYTNRVIPNWEGRMPLLVSSANMMHGSSKRQMLDKAEKVVYYCERLPTTR
jgi:hypothetical protein